MSKWEIKKLSEICEFSNGLWSGKKPPFQNVGVIRNTNFTKDCQLDDSDIVYLDVEQSQFQKRKLKYGDIILEKSGGGPKQPVGRVVIFNRIEGDFSFSNFTSVIRIKNQTEVDFNFLHRYLFFEYLSGATEKMQSHSTGIRNLKFDEYKEIEIPLPPLPEQQRIVYILDKCFAAIDKAKENAEQNLKNARELFESYLEGVFDRRDWQRKTIQEITKVVNGYAFASKDFKSTNSAKSIKITNVGVKEFVEEDDNYLPEKFKEALKDYQVREGNIVIALTRTIITTGLKVAVVPSSYDGALVNQRVAALVPNEQLVNQNYLYFYLGTKEVARYVTEHVNTLMQPNLSINDLKSMSVPCPSLKSQQSIVRQLDALRAETQRLEAVYEKKIADLEELKKSILQKAFAGELKSGEFVELKKVKAEL
jgi:type I restriction enzyme S subunit